MIDISTLPLLREAQFGTMATTSWSAMVFTAWRLSVCSFRYQRPAGGRTRRQGDYPYRRTGGGAHRQFLTDLELERSLV
jgi:hypothetical protein